MEISYNLVHILLLKWVSELGISAPLLMLARVLTEEEELEFVIRIVGGTTTEFTTALMLALLAYMILQVG